MFDFLFFFTAAIAYTDAHFGQGTGLPILLDNVKCSGKEGKLTSCQYDTNTVEDSHSEDAGVKCLPGNAC